MKTKKIKSDCNEKTAYKFIDNHGDSFIIRRLYPNYWIANRADKLEECSDENNCCVSFDTKRKLLIYLNSF